MNFLNKAKEQASKMNTKGESPMGNPFLKKTDAPTVKPVAPTNAPKALGLPGKPGMPKPPAAPGVKPSVPGVKPAVPGMKPPVPPMSKPAAPKAPAPVVEEVTPAPAPEVVETPAVEEVKVETKVEVTAAANEEANKEIEKETAEPKTAKEEKAPAKKKGSRKKTTKAEADVADTTESVELPADIVIPTTSVSYADAIATIQSNFVDEEWEAFRTQIQTSMSEIMISNDLNKHQVCDLLAQVSTLRDEISVIYADTKTLYENLSSKEDGLIERVKKLNGKGSNAEERKITGLLATINYKDREGNAVNLYEVLDETRGRFNFLKNIMESIEFKKSVLLTMLSSLKSN